ncbi:vitamin D3 receptor-like [Apostichopus japonicus]|uniref:vitamin D3 receptor-like n=1 Tax=Stichopus japonicus TaxID=307972 RepID=UPI003AB3FE72
MSDLVGFDNDDDSELGNFVTSLSPSSSSLGSSQDLSQSEQASSSKIDDFILDQSNPESSKNLGQDRICLICGDKANGVHYNVLSCEGCKSFFLRNIKQKTEFVCAQGGKCDMDLYTRRHCPACRMKRCLECGMNIERVWDPKRLQTRKPLVRMKRKKKRPRSPKVVSQSPQWNSPLAPLSVDQSELLDRLEKGYSASKDLFRNITRGIPEKFVNYWTQASSVRHPNSITDDSKVEKNTQETLEPSPKKEDEVITTTPDPSENHKGGTTCLPSIHKVTEYLTKGCASGGNSNKDIKLPEHCEPVHKEMLHLAMDMFATVVKQTIHFAKNIPGFTDLTCDDQAVLIKSSIVDALLLRCTESFELEKGYLENPFNGDKFDINMMYYMGFSALPEPAFQFMRSTKACGLNKAEFALLTAAAIIAPDRSDLKNRDLAESMQTLLISTLYSATKHFHPDKPLLFANLMSKLTTLRDMSVLHLSELMEVQVRETDLSPLVVELFGLDS